jgi:hypothetical protein
MKKVFKTILLLWACGCFAAALFAESGKCFKIVDRKIVYQKCSCNCHQEKKFPNGKCTRCEDYQEPEKLALDFAAWKKVKQIAKR